jgi:hypothetical protein
MGVLAPLFAAMQATPIGWIADVILIGYGGWGVVDLIKTFIELDTNVKNARCEPDIDAAAKALASQLVKSAGEIAGGAGGFGALKAGGAFTRVGKGIRSLFEFANRRRVNTGNAANRATFELYKDSLISKMEKPTVSDPTLSGLLDDLYRPGGKIGSGSTADAVRYERATGQPVGNVFHTQKANDYSAALQKWLDKNPKAPAVDRAAAENVIRDLQNALKG